MGYSIVTGGPLGARPWILLLLVALSMGCSHAGPKDAAARGYIRLRPDGKGFAFPSGEKFTPWGFNYDDGHKMLSSAEYGEADWARVAKDFREMKKLGATVVRICLQFPRFMKSPAEADARGLDFLGRLLRIAEETGLLLDLTGLASFRKQDVPDWYDRATEKERWEMQARFWEAVASGCAGSPAVFCYNLMNEPVSPAGRKDGWLAGDFAGYYFVEFISRDQADRPRTAITKEWIEKLRAAIRKHDPARLVTVGMFFIFPVPKGLTLGEDVSEFADALDFLMLHVYPKTGQLDEDLRLLESLRIGKPVVLEEFAALYCRTEALREFLVRSRDGAAGWIGFYNGKTIEEHRRSRTIADAIMLDWLEFFRDHGALFKGR